MNMDGLQEIVLAIAQAPRRFRTSLRRSPLAAKAASPEGPRGSPAAAINKQRWWIELWTASHRDDLTPQNCRRERNRGRREIRVLECQETTPESVCFPAAAQIAKLRRRVRREGKLSTETGHLISSLPQENRSASGLQSAKRDYWSIESALHYRLDEDKSRVRTPKAVRQLPDSGNVPPSGRASRDPMVEEKETHPQARLNP